MTPYFVDMFRGDTSLVCQVGKGYHEGSITGVKDVSLPTPLTIPSAKDEIRGIAIGVVLLCAIFASFTGGVWYLFKTTTVDQVNIAMPIV
jgi:hypothetical protein